MSKLVEAAASEAAVAWNESTGVVDEFFDGIRESFNEKHAEGLLPDTEDDEDNNDESDIQDFQILILSLTQETISIKPLLTLFMVVINSALTVLFLMSEGVREAVRWRRFWMRLSVLLQTESKKSCFLARM